MSYNDHHIKALAKHLLTQAVSVAVGLSRVDSFCCAISDIERNPARRNRVLFALLDAGYIEHKTGEALFTIADKVFDEVKAEPWVSEVRVGSPREPLAMWLSLGILKSVYEKLADGSAYVTFGDNGSLGVVARSSGPGEFSEFLLSHLGELARKHTDIGRASADCLSIANWSGTMEPGDLEALVGVSLLSRRKDLERAKREVDALVSLSSSVEAAGGWDVFVQRAHRDHGELS